MHEVINFFHFKSYINLGNKFFLLGTFFLPSALPISAIFFIFSLIISYSNKNFITFKDKWNIPLFISLGLIIFSTFNISVLRKTELLSQYNYSYIWINLFNWIPIFFYFWGFQLYLKNYDQRINFVKFLFSGTMPVIFSMILQKFFKIYGPFETFFGLIVWFQKPLKNNAVTGLFSNPNYTAIFLAMVLPFVFFLFKNIKKLNLKKYFLLIIFILYLYFVFLTQSRNGLLGVLLTFLFVFRFKRFSVSILSSLSFAFSGILLFIASNYDKFNFYFPNNLFNRLFEFDVSKLYRPIIWESTILRIQERPMFGWGGSTFSFLHEKYENMISVKGQFISAYHSHNMFLELSHNFGLPLSILLCITIFLFVFKAWYLIYIKDYPLKKSLIDKSWLVSIVIFLVMQMTDITFYDGKISILVCILFAGLRNIIRDINIKITNLKIN